MKYPRKPAHRGWTIAIQLCAGYYFADFLYIGWAHGAVAWRQLALGLVMLLVGLVERRKTA